MQVGYVGLLKAINSFDPDVGVNLSAYARPCIIKRHFRDKRWVIHVQRSVQELRLQMRTATVDLIQQLQRIPTDAEIAAHLGISGQELAQARGADSAFQLASLDAPLTPGSATDGSWELADMIGAIDEQLDQVIDMEAVAAYWPQLPAVQRPDPADGRPGSSARLACPASLPNAARRPTASPASGRPSTA
jgi:RNA polymerase sigma-B factor